MQMPLLLNKSMDTIHYGWLAGWLCPLRTSARTRVADYAPFDCADDLDFYAEFDKFGAHALQ
jgi:hypothetical protein